MAMGDAMTEWQRAIIDMLANLKNGKQEEESVAQRFTAARQSLRSLVEASMDAGLSEEEAVLYTMDLVEIKSTTESGRCTAPMRLIEGMLANEFPDAFGIEPEDKDLE